MKYPFSVDWGQTNREFHFIYNMSCSYYSVCFSCFCFGFWKWCCFSPASLCVPPSHASVACSETASFINAAPTQLQAQALNSWPEFRPQLTLSLFVCISLSFPPLPLVLSPFFLHLISPRGLFFISSRFHDISDTFWANRDCLMWLLVRKLSAVKKQDGSEPLWLKPAHWHRRTFSISCETLHLMLFLFNTCVTVPGAHMTLIPLTEFFLVRMIVVLFVVCCYPQCITWVQSLVL